MKTVFLTFFCPSCGAIKEERLKDCREAIFICTQCECLYRVHENASDPDAISVTAILKEGKTIGKGL